MAAPPRVITVPDTERLSIDLPPESASLYAVKSNPEPRTKVNPTNLIPWRSAIIFQTAFQCLFSVGLWEWPATAGTAFELSGLIMVDTHPHQAAHSLPLWAVCSKFALLPWTYFHTGGRGDVGDELTPKQFSMLSMNAFCVISSVPNKAQPVYEVSLPRLLWGI